MRQETPSPAVCFAALMPHAPVLVPAVGQERCSEVKSTIKAMRDVARTCLALRPDRLVVVSPHAPRRHRCFGIQEGPRARGSLGRFSAPEVTVDFPTDSLLSAALVQHMIDLNLRSWQISRDQELDHGTVVPLWFMAEAGWRGPVTVISLNYPGEPGLPELGQAISFAADDTRTRVAIIASGDMSHRLIPGAPCGYHPRAAESDRRFLDALGHPPPVDLGDLDTDLLDEAAEDAVDSTRVALAACRGRANGRRVLSYEGPFGVGYGVAILFQESPAQAPARTLDSFLPGIARASLEAAFAKCDAAAPVLPATHPLAGRRAGVFVTLRGREDELRGCVGTSEPSQTDIAAETWNNARAAAFRDRRFPPLKAKELDRLSIEVSVLEPPEAVDSPAELDPRRFGIIVSADDGRRALLLPDIEGIDDPEAQIEVTCRKAGIRPHEPVHLQRFRVTKYRESEPGV